MQIEDTYINIHTHAPPRGQELALVNLRADEVAGAQAYVSRGIHPWHLSGMDVEAAMETLEQQARSGALAAVGEVGLDRAIATPMEQQEAVLLQQLDLAERYALPVIIHCVKAYADFARILKQSRPEVPLIFHGFNANATVLKQLLHSKVYFSFGQALLQHAKTRETFQHVPLEHVFLETDTADVSIQRIYEEAAVLRGMACSTLIQALGENFQRVFLQH